MWRSRKFVVIVLLAVVVLTGSIGGVVFAQTEDGDESQVLTLMARVAEKLGIDEQILQDAFAEVKSEMREEAMNSRLQEAVEEGSMTQEEADQYQEWRQSKPDVEFPKSFGRDGRRGFRGHRGYNAGIGNFGGPAGAAMRSF